MYNRYRYPEPGHHRLRPAENAVRRQRVDDATTPVPPPDL